MATELEIALVQSSLSWEDPEANRKLLAGKIAAVAESTDLICLPEMFSTGFTMHPSNIKITEGPQTLAWMKELAGKRDAAICGSVVFQDGDMYYNRLLFVCPGGEVYTYDKRHTFTLAGENKVYAAGRSKLLLSFRGFRICPLICYDLRFPVWSRNVEGYDLLLYVANWPARRILAWDTLLRARAIENMAYCAGVNRIGTDSNGHSYNGHSAVYDSLGARVAYSDEETILYARLNLESLQESRDALKFLDDRDNFTLVP